MTDWEYFSEELSLGNYQPAKEKLGQVEADECYANVPLLGIRGAENVENLQRVKLREHISIVAQALGKIE
nr:T6SS immunity protein Tdi1 domain-containing protein [Sphingobacterium athyrii]